MKIYVGSIVKDAVYHPDQLIGNVKIYTKLGISKSRFYDILKEPEMDPAYVIQIGKIIGRDFSKDISELKRYEDPTMFVEEEPKTSYLSRQQLEYDMIELQRKYIHALEDIRDLQKRLMECEKKG